MRNMASKRIEDYGIIGNTKSAALVGYDGSIDWLCLPRFDSAACFSALLGNEEHGRWKLSPRGKVISRSRAYRANTAILETRFKTKTGEVTLIDFMPISEGDSKVEVVRIIRGDRGSVAMSMELVLRFNYGQSVPWVRRRDYGLSAVAGPDAVELHTPVSLHGQNLRTVSNFTVRKGQTVPFTLSYHPAHHHLHFVMDAKQSLDRTTAFWNDWIEPFDCSEMKPLWRNAVVRSLITLKLLTYRPTGGIVAAATTSLPEMLGGERNWDYRFCWLRDSALTMYALLNAGFRHEASSWREWLLRAIAGHPEQLQIVYGVAGERHLREYSVDWLPGYEKSRPVRIGNAAYLQLQLDVYGEVMETLHAARVAQLPTVARAWELQKVMLKHLERRWKCADQGMWEMRGQARIFTHSRAMTWVAFDRAISSATRFKLKGPVAHWRKIRNRIRKDIFENGIHSGGYFSQSYGESGVDASLLLLAQMGIVRATDARFKATVKVVEKELLLDGFVKRYSVIKARDGLRGDEAAFIPCNFWLADAYILIGSMKRAQSIFEKTLTVRNDLGLLSEEYDPVSHRLVGNFPQAFSHIALINTAFNLMKSSGPARQRTRKTAPREPRAGAGSH